MSRDLTTPGYWDGQWRGARSRRAPRRMAVDRLLTRFLDLAGEAPVDVLELGCAPGDLLERMYRLRPRHRYHGLDYSPEGIAATRARLDAAGVEAALHEGDLRAFDRPGAFDLVLSLGLLEHFEDPAAIVRAHARLCRPGGHVALSVPNYASPVPRWFLARMDPGALETHRLPTMQVDVLQRAFEAAGLEGVDVGGVGGPKVRTRTADRTLARRVLRGVARLINGLGRVVPGSLAWHSTLVATGRVPRAPSNGPGNPVRRHGISLE